MLESIAIRSCASYDEQGVVLDGLGKVNVVFGANGTGKTTISKMMAEPAEYPECDVQWDLMGELPVYVYNRHFRDHCVRASEIPGVYTVGEENADAVARIEVLKEQIAEMEQQKAEELEAEAARKAELRDAWEGFKEEAWLLKSGRKAGKKGAAVEGYYEVFKPAFAGCSQKESFARKLLERCKMGPVLAVDEADLKSRAAVLFSKEAPLPAGDMRAEAEQARALQGGIASFARDEIWQRPIVGNADLPIAALINELGCSDWVKRGTVFLRGDGVCPFCQQKTVTGDLAAQIEAFFDGAYQADVERIAHLQGNIEKAKVVAGTIAVRAQELDSACEHVDFKQTANLAEGLAMALNLCESRAKEKATEPSSKVEMLDPTSQLESLIAAMDRANSAAAEYNYALNSRTAESARLVDDVWTFFAGKYERVVAAYRFAASSISAQAEMHHDSAEDLEEAIGYARSEMAELSRQAATVSAAVSGINQLLEEWNASGFKLAECSQRVGCYEIVRPDGSAAGMTLSEGEEALVAFAYFAQHAQGARSMTEVGSKRVMVIDDPVSCLDADAKVNVMDYLRVLAQDVAAGRGDVEQLLLLTHDLELFDSFPKAKRMTLVKEDEVTKLAS